MKKIVPLLLLLTLGASLQILAQAFPRFSEERLNHLLYISQYPRFEKPSFWIRDIKGEPVLGAKIEIKFKMPIVPASLLGLAQMAGPEKHQLTLTECDTQGLYAIDTLEPAWYKVSIKARGYAHVEFYWEVIERSKPFFKIVLCPPAYEPIYWGQNLVYWRPEQQAWTVLSLKNPSNNFEQNTSKLKAIMDEVQPMAPLKLQYHGSMLAFQWPAADSTQRQIKKLLDAHKEIESPMYSFSPDPFKGNWTGPRCELVVQGSHDSLAVRKYFWDFDCKVMYCEIKGDQKSMRLMLSYRGVMHLDYFRRFSNFLKGNTVSLIYPHGGGYVPPPEITPPPILRPPLQEPNIRKPR